MSQSKRNVAPTSSAGNAAARDSQTTVSNGGGNQATLAKVVSLHLEGKRKDALEEIDRILATGQSTPEVYSAKAHLQFELEQYEPAVGSYEKLLSSNPDDPAANFNLALCLEKLGRWKDAASRFGKTLKAEPSRQEAQLGLAICLIHTEQLDEAVAAFDKVLRHAADNASVLSFRNRECHCTRTASTPKTFLAEKRSVSMYISVFRCSVRGP